MISTNRCHCTAIDVITDDVCGINATSKSALNHCEVYCLLLKPKQGKHRGDIKESAINLLLLYDLKNLVSMFHYLAFRDALLVYLDTLAKRLYVRRSE